MCMCNDKLKKKKKPGSCFQHVWKYKMCAIMIMIIEHYVQFCYNKWENFLRILGWGATLLSFLQNKFFFDLKIFGEMFSVWKEVL